MTETIMDFPNEEIMRGLDWVTRHEVLEIMESWARNPTRQAMVMRMIIKTMGPDELLHGMDNAMHIPSETIIQLPNMGTDELIQGMDNATHTPSGTIISLPDKIPMQITLPELFKRQRSVRDDQTALRPRRA
jgi:hypothetical protein